MVFAKARTIITVCVMAGIQTVWLVEEKCGIKQVKKYPLAIHLYYRQVLFAKCETLKQCVL